MVKQRVRNCGTLQLAQLELWDCSFLLRYDSYHIKGIAADSRPKGQSKGHRIADTIGLIERSNAFLIFFPDS